MSEAEVFIAQGSYFRQSVGAGNHIGCHEESSGRMDMDEKN